MANISFDILVYDGALSTQTNLVPLMGASVTLTQPYSQGGHPAGTSYTVLTNLFGIADFLVPNGNILYTTDISKTGYTPQHFDAQQYGDGGTRLLAMLQPVPVSVTVDPPSASIQVGGTANFNASPTGGVPPYALEWVDEATGAYLGSGLTFTYTGAAVGSFGLIARATDSLGAVASSQPAAITVTEGGGPPPPPTDDLFKIGLIAAAGIAGIVLVTETKKRRK